MSTEIPIGRAVQPAIRQVRIEEVDGDLELSYRQGDWGGGCFLLLWLCGWTAGCTMLVRQFVLDPTFFHVLVAIPFLTSWVFVFAMLIWMFFGVERARLSREGLEHRVTALVTLTRRWVPRLEWKEVCAGMHKSFGKRGEQPCLTIETLGQPIYFACGISTEEQRWLVEWLKDYLAALGPSEAAHERSATSICTEKSTPQAIFQPLAVPIEPLSNSRIEVRSHADSIAFIWQGKRSWPAIVGGTFFILFWNGILGLFICKQVEELNWFLFFFMIPHEIIGLCGLALWLAALTAPAWRLTWTFDERQAVRRLSFSDVNGAVFDFGWSKRFAIHPPIRIELRREGNTSPGLFWSSLCHPDGEYTLSLLDQADKKLLSIKRLTEGDARWIADVLLRAFPSWSRNDVRFTANRNASCI